MEISDLKSKLSAMHVLRRCTVLCLLIICVMPSGSVLAGVELPTDYPRIMGMNIGKKNYDDPKYLDALSRLNVVILGFYPGWKGGTASIEMAVRAIKERNPKILIGQYTVLTETQDAKDRSSADSDRGEKLDKEGWWLLNEKGERVQWTDKYKAFETNITHWTRPDDNGLRYPEWLARRDHDLYFRIPGFDIWYFDNALSKPTVKNADWKRNGKDDINSDPEIAKTHREGHVAEWQEAKQLRPDMFLMGNSDDLSSSEFSGKLHGAFLEALIGTSWSMERWQGWGKMMSRYHETMAHTAPPHLVGFNVWGKKDDYQRMRYGLSSSLMDNGYFCYTDEKVGFSSVVWFDEYDLDLGAAIDPPAIKPWRNGIYRRNFEKGTVLVNPNGSPASVTLEPRYKRFKGTQAPEVNNGLPVQNIILPGKDGIILIRD